MNDSPMQVMTRRLARGETIVLDGATGTEIERRGAVMHEGAWCATATASHPDILRAVHEDYIHAGARIITANTFSTNRNMLEPAGLADQFESLNRQAVAIALEARDRAGVADVVVAGSMSHQVPVAPGSDKRAERALPSPAVAAQNFRDMADVLADSGVDLLLMEMMSDPELMMPAITAAKATGLPVWIGFSVKRDEAGLVRSFSRPDVSVEQMFEAVDFDGIDAAGIMHSSAEVTPEAVTSLRKYFAGPLMAYPDSGYFKMPNWQFVDIMSPEQLVVFCEQWASGGVQIVGGCCGLGLEHIRALSQSLTGVR